MARHPGGPARASSGPLCPPAAQEPGPGRHEGERAPGLSRVSHSMSGMQLRSSAPAARSLGLGWSRLPMAGPKVEGEGDAAGWLGQDGLEGVGSPEGRA